MNQILSRMNPKVWKAVVAVGAMGALVAGARVIIPAGKLSAFSEVNDDVNAQLSLDVTTHVALWRMNAYKSGNPDAFRVLLIAVGDAVSTEKIKTPRTNDLRRMNNSVNHVRDSCKKLRHVTERRTNGNVEVMMDFDEIVETILSRCIDSHFNVNQAYVV